MFYWTGIQREEEKVKRSMKEAAKKGDRAVCVILAKEVLRARKAITKIQTSKAHLNSIQLQMKNQLGESCVTCTVCVILAMEVLWARKEITKIQPSKAIVVELCIWAIVGNSLVKTSNSWKALEFGILRFNSTPPTTLRLTEFLNSYIASLQSPCLVR